MSLRRWGTMAVESGRLAAAGIRAQPLRSSLAVMGVVIGIVTVTLVTSVLAGVRGQVALLFREFGSDNIFAFHRRGDPYSPASQAEAQRRVLDPAWAEPIARLGDDIREVGVQLIVPTVVGGRALTARANGGEADRALVEGLSANFFEVTGAEFEAGRPFTAVEAAAGARVAVVGANIAKALYGRGASVGQRILLGGTEFFVVGEAAPRKGGFFGENRQDNVIAVPYETARRLYPSAEETVFYIRAEPGRRDAARVEAEAILRRLRDLAPDQENDFHLSTADQIIAQLDQVSALIGLVTLALAAVSLGIGGIGIANVMIIAVTERTREIGVRRAIGAPRREVMRQFLLEAAMLSLAGGALGVLISWALGVLLYLVAPALASVPPLWVVAAGLTASFATGVIAGYGPARRASLLDPVEALRYE